MKPNWRLLALTVPGAGALALLVLVLITYQDGNQPSMSDMERVAEIGAIIGGLLTFTWPVRLLMR
jgi:hypothetical protein